MHWYEERGSLLPDLRNQTRNTRKLYILLFIVESLKSGGGFFVLFVF